MDFLISSVSPHASVSGVSLLKRRVDCILAALALVIKLRFAQRVDESSVLSLEDLTMCQDRDHDRITLTTRHELCR